jgi:hypothetical protein
VSYTDEMLVYEIAYLTMHGWAPKAPGVWCKEGVLRKTLPETETRWNIEERKEETGFVIPSPLEDWGQHEAYTYQKSLEKK